MLRAALGPTHNLTRLSMRNLAALLRGDESAALEAEAKGLRDICSYPACCSRGSGDIASSDAVDLRLKACAACRSIRYCCITCQRAHYKDHKAVCSLVSRRNLASEPRAER